MELLMADLQPLSFLNENRKIEVEFLLFDKVAGELSQEDILNIFFVSFYLKKRYGKSNLANYNNIAWNFCFGWNNVLEDSQRISTEPKRKL